VSSLAALPPCNVKKKLTTEHTEKSSNLKMMKALYRPPPLCSLNVSIYFVLCILHVFKKGLIIKSVENTELPSAPSASAQRLRVET